MAARNSSDVGALRRLIIEAQRRADHEEMAQAYQTLIQTRSDAEVARAGLDKAMGTLGNGATP